MRGSVIFDDRTNSLLVTLTQERIDELRRIVTLLDVPVRQVMIEARIVEANVDYDKSLGVRWGGSQTFANDRGVFYGNDDRGDEGGKSGADSSGNFPFVDLGVLGRTSGFGIGYVTDNLILDLELTAMEKTGNGEIVSQPRWSPPTRKLPRSSRARRFPTRKPAPAAPPRPRSRKRRCRWR